MIMLKTVTFCQSVPLRKEGEREVMLDTIQTYYDMTDPAITKLATKFPGTHFSIEKQTRPLNKMPVIETSESFRAMKRYPSMTPEEREKFNGVAVKSQSGKAFAPAPVAVTKPAAPATYTTLVNEMMKDAS